MPAHQSKMRCRVRARSSRSPATSSRAVMADRVYPESGMRWPRALTSGPPDLYDSPVLRCVVGVIVMVAWSSAAHAVDDRVDERSEEARLHSVEGDSQYKLKRWVSALQEYEQAYLAKPDPSFLVSIGECHRQLDDLAQAIRFYRRYLSDAPGGRYRELAEKRVAQLEKKLGVAAKKASEPTTPPSSSAPPPAAAPPAAKPPAAVPPVVKPPARTARRGNDQRVTACAVVDGAAAARACAVAANPHAAAAHLRFVTPTPAFTAATPPRRLRRRTPRPPAPRNQRSWSRRRRRPSPKATPCSRSAPMRPATSRVRSTPGGGSGPGSAPRSPAASPPSCCCERAIRRARRDGSANEVPVSAGNRRRCRGASVGVQLAAGARAPGRDEHGRIQRRATDGARERRARGLLRARSPPGPDAVRDRGISALRHSRDGHPEGRGSRGRLPARHRHEDRDGDLVRKDIRRLRVWSSRRARSRLHAGRGRPRRRGGRRGRGRRLHGSRRQRRPGTGGGWRRR